MAQKTGSEQSFSLAHRGGSFYAIINYTTSQTNTAYTVTISSIQVWTDGANEQGYGTQDVPFAGVLSSTGYSNANYSGTGKSGYANTVTLGSSITRSWSRGTADATKTISLSVGVTGNQYGDLRSIASFSVTVPKLQSYTISYNANGGSGAPSATTKYYNTSVTLSSTRPVKDGYTFKGWATSTANAAAGTVAYQPGATYPSSSNANATLYAVWELTYQLPIISGLTAERCDSNGTYDDEGQYAKVSFSWSVYNTSAARYYGGSTYPYANNSATCSITVGTISVTPTLTGSSGTVSVVVGNDSYDVDTQYDVTVTVTDTQTLISSHSTTVYSALAKALFPMDFNADATAVGFFTPAPDNQSGIFLAKDTYFSHELYIELDDNAASGVDHDLIAAITALGWQNDVLV